MASPLNTRFADPELAHCLADSRAGLLFYDATFRDRIEALKAACPQLARTIPLDPEQAGADPSEYDRLIAAADPLPRAEAAEDEPALIIYTGGTTGAPKGVVLSVCNVSAAVTSMLWTGLGRDGDAALHLAPMFHASGALAVYIWTALAGRHLFLPRFDAGEVLRLVESERLRTLILAPTMLQMLLEHPDCERSDLSSLQRLIYGMSPMPEALLRRARERLPDVGFVQCYGQTETAGAVVFLQPEDHLFTGAAAARLRAAGRAHPLATIALFDAAGREAPAGEVGEICVRSPLVMTGYLRQPEQTAEALRDGWLHTGDLGRMDADGYLYVVDRAKDMIISGGENIYSVEVENALASHPQVRMAAVIGAPDPLWGERVHAVVALKPGASVTEAALIEHCRARIAAYKCPRSIDLRDDELPLTAAGKIAKAELRRLLTA